MHSNKERFLPSVEMTINQSFASEKPAALMQALSDAPVFVTKVQLIDA
jgi:hypothetical protein